MKAMFWFTLECPSTKFCITLYKRHSMPFCPPIGLEMYMDECEHTVTKVHWSPLEQELGVCLDGNLHDSDEEVREEAASFMSSGWYSDATEHLMGD